MSNLRSEIHKKEISLIFGFNLPNFTSLKNFTFVENSGEIGSQFKFRDVLFYFHLKFWNTNSIGIPARSLL